MYYPAASQQTAGPVPLPDSYQTIAATPPVGYPQVPGTPSVGYQQAVATAPGGYPVIPVTQSSEWTT